MLEEQETEAQRVRLEIETRGRAALTEAENEATALRHLGQAHSDNRAVVSYELARRRVEVGEKLMQQRPPTRPHPRRRRRAISPLHPPPRPAPPATDRGRLDSGENQ